MDYDRLNDILKNEIENNKEGVDLLKETSKLAKIIIENTELLPEDKYNEYVFENESRQISIDFMNSLSNELGEKFKSNLVKEDVFLHFNEDKSSSVDINGETNLYLSNNIKDIYTVVHEIIHKMDRKGNNQTTIKNYLGETSPIIGELLLEDYLEKETDLNKSEIHIRNKKRINDTLEDAKRVFFENIVFELYKEKGKINEKVIVDYIDNLEKPSTEYSLLYKDGTKYLSDFIWNGPKYNERQRYVIGTLLATDFINNDNINKVDNLNTLIDVLSHNEEQIENDLNILSNLDIPIIKDGRIDTSTETLNRLENNYKKEYNKRKNNLDFMFNEDKQSNKESNKTK